MKGCVLARHLFFCTIVDHGRHSVRAAMKVSRRGAAAVALTFTAPMQLLHLSSLPAIAFENRLPVDELEAKYKSPRTPGPKPTDMGPLPGGLLKSCTDGKPHCFSSSPEVFEDNDLFNADYGTTEGWLIPPFKFDKPVTEAWADLKAVVSEYPPGQRGIDGGGFKIITESTSQDDTAYIYVQFESRRRGYIDDFEMALRGGMGQIRTSSRLGYLDYGVNAKRVNYFAEALQARGWKTTPLLSKGHEEYFSLNGVTDKDMSGSAMVVKADKVKLPSGPASPF